MSPEQAQREEVIDLRSDVYSLGIIAFEMLTQGLPFEGNLPVSVLLKHIYDPPPSLGAVNPDLPAALDPVLQCALAKDPEERYQTAGEFIIAFKGALHQGGSRQPTAVELKPSSSRSGIPRTSPDRLKS
jgi:serine/threonine-protein kinase